MSRSPTFLKMVSKLEVERTQNTSCTHISTRYKFVKMAETYVSIYKHVDGFVVVTRNKVNLEYTKRFFPRLKEAQEYKAHLFQEDPDSKTTYEF